MDTEKEKRAIAHLKAFEPKDGYFIAYSGGKDSDCIRVLAQLAGVKHELHHSLTTVDAPETVRYVKSIDGVIIDKRELSMFGLIEKMMFPPTRIIRYCCKYFKEYFGENRRVVTGVRWEESRSRKERSGAVTIIGAEKTNKKISEEIGANAYETSKGRLVLNEDNDKNRRFVENCYRTSRVLINPIVDWTENDVWEFLKIYGVEGNPLYKCGEKRIGCIGCPMSGKKGRKIDFEKYPTYKRAYIRAFKKMNYARIANGKTSLFDGNTIKIFKWWMEEDFNQLTLEETMEILGEIDG